MDESVPAFEDHEELLSGQEDLDRAIAQGEYDFAKTRFVRSLDSERLTRLIEKAAKQRVRLREEIENLRVLTRARHETAVERARAYGEILPHRVGKTWIQPPAAFEKIGEFYGADRSYKRAAHAAKEYVEARELLVKRRDQLIALETELRQKLDDREAALLRQLDSPRSLRAALALDPLLNLSYQKLQALRDDLGAEAPVEDGIGDL
jgi:hypothetical protein